MAYGLDRWIERNGLRTDRRWAPLLAPIALALCIGSLILGSELQRALKLPLVMGWGQQLAAGLMALLLAALLREFRPQLGLRWPPRAAWGQALGLGLSIALVGLGVEVLSGPEPAPRGLEYFLYEATAPGLGEELSLRGPWLCLLAVGLARWRPPAAGVWLLLLASLPFALLHVLEPMPLLKLSLILGYTLYAGIGLAWLRLSSGSIWPAVLAHNIANVANGLLSLWVLGQ